MPRRRDFRESELFEGMLNEVEKEKVESSPMRIPAIFGTVMHKHSNVHRDCKCALAIERYHKKCLIENPLDAVR